MSEHIWWYTARSGGIVALVLLSFSVVWGLLFSTRILMGQPTPKWLLALHSHLSGLSVIFTAVHLLGLLADRYVDFGVSEILVPFASTFRPAAVAWGVVAMYLMVAVELSSLMKRYMSRRTWRLIHLSSYGLFWMSVVHGSKSGTDASHPLYFGFSVAAVLIVVFLTGYRVLMPRRAARLQSRVGQELSVPMGISGGREGRLSTDVRSTSRR